MSTQPCKAAAASAEDFACAICLSAPLVDPVTTPCGHSFDKACYESYLHSSAAQFRRRECPLCKKPVSSRCPEVSVLLRDAISRLFPEGRRRCEGEMFEELEAGVVRRETLDFLLARLRAARECEDTGSLLQLLSLFTTAMTREAQTVQDVGIQLAFKELSKALLALLSQEPVLNTGYCTLLEVLQQAVETLSQYWLEHLLVPSQQPALSLVRGQFGQQVAGLACEASALLPQLSDGPVLRLAVLVLEAAVMGLAGARWQLQREQGSSISASLLGVIAIPEETDALHSLNVVCLRTFGSLVTILPELLNPSPVWCHARQKLQDALCQKDDIELAAASAQACGAVLDRSLCPASDLTPWLKSLMLGAQSWLSTSSAGENPPFARRLLSLLGDVHRFAPSDAAAKEELHDLLGEGRYLTTCGLIISAGRHACGGDRELKLGVLEAWEGVLALVQNLPQDYALDAFRHLVPHVISVIIMNLVADEEEFASTSRALLGDLLQLALDGGWPLGAIICGAWQAEPDAKRALRKACGLDLLIRKDVHHRIELLAKQLSLSTEEDASKTAAASLFGGMALPTQSRASRRSRKPGAARATLDATLDGPGNGPVPTGSTSSSSSSSTWLSASALASLDAQRPISVPSRLATAPGRRPKRGS